MPIAQETHPIASPERKKPLELFPNGHDDFLIEIYEDVTIPLRDFLRDELGIESPDDYRDDFLLELLFAMTDLRPQQQSDKGHVLTLITETGDELRYVTKGAGE